MLHTWTYLFVCPLWDSTKWTQGHNMHSWLVYSNYDCIVTSLIWGNKYLSKENIKMQGKKDLLSLECEARFPPGDKTLSQMTALHIGFAVRKQRDNNKAKCTFSSKSTPRLYCMEWYQWYCPHLGKSSHLN